MAIEVKLEAEGTPRGDAQIAEPEPLIDEVEIIMQAFPTVGLEKGLTGLLVMPGLIRRAGFHGGEDMHEPRVGAAMTENVLDPIFRPKALQFAANSISRPCSWPRVSAWARIAFHKGSANRG